MVRKALATDPDFSFKTLWKSKHSYSIILRLFRNGEDTGINIEANPYFAHINNGVEISGAERDAAILLAGAEYKAVQ